MKLACKTEGTDATDSSISLLSIYSAIKRVNPCFPIIYILSPIFKGETELRRYV